MATYISTALLESHNIPSFAGAAGKLMLKMYTLVHEAHGDDAQMHTEHCRRIYTWTRRGLEERRRIALAILKAYEADAARELNVHDVALCPECHSWKLTLCRCPPCEEGEGHPPEVQMVVESEGEGEHG